MKTSKFKLIVIPLLFLSLMVLSSQVPPIVQAVQTYVDGEYAVPFEVLKDNSNEVSATSDYMISPAKIVIENGKMNAIVTLKNSSWWQYFKVQSFPSSSFLDVTIINEDEEEGLRTVSFEVGDIKLPLQAQIHIIVTGIPGFNYDNKYDIQLQFDDSKITVEETSSQNEVNLANPENQESLENDSSPTETDTVAETIHSEDKVELLPVGEGMENHEEPISESATTEDVVTEESADTDRENLDLNVEKEEPTDFVDGLEADQTEGQTVKEEALSADEGTEEKASGFNWMFVVVILAVGIILLLFMVSRRSKK